MRHAVIVASVWTASLLAVSFAGYILASTGAMGEVGRSAVATGRDPERVAQERGIAEVLRSTERTAVRLNAFFFPAVAALFGAIVGLSSPGRTVPLTVIAMAPLLAFILASRNVSRWAVAWSGLYLATALAVAIALARSRRARSGTRHAGPSAG
jgi:hypothetical protein